MSVEAAAQEIGVHKAEAVLFFTLLQLTVVVLAGRIGSSLAVRFGQSTAVGEIIVRGIEKRQARILVGSDAKAVSILERIAPVSYWRYLKKATSR